MKRETASVRSNPKKCLGKYHLPGFRFHPTEHELVGFYLKNVLQGKHTIFNVIRMLDLYRYDPWELPNLGRAGEIELFFFVPRDKNGSGRTNRIAVSGFWKATGSDRQILDEHARCIGLRKTLVFYKGRALRGEKTNWVMKEYRMPDDYKPKAEVVVCRIFRKAASLKWLEQQALNPVEDHPSVDDGDSDDDLDGSNKPHEPDFSSPVVLDKELGNEDGGRGEVSTASSSESAEWREAKQISVTTKLQLTHEASSSVEDNYVAQTELVSSSAPVSDPNVSGDSIDPAFQDFVDDDICEGLSVCRGDSNVSFMDLLHSSTDCSCLDPTLSASLMDGESTRAENRLQLVPDFCMDSFGNEVAFDSNLNLAENCPLWDLWAPPPNSFNLLDHASSAVKYTFFDSQECL